MVDSAIASLIGALIGASAGLSGALLTSWWQSKSEHKKWLRAKREDAYSNAMRFLIRTNGKRSGITTYGSTYIAKGHLKEWFDELSELKQWMMILQIYCSDDYKEQIGKVSDELSTEIDKFYRPEIPIDSGDTDVIIIPTIERTLKVVLSCARSDLGREITKV